jgi:hypothetical protein
MVAVLQPELDTGVGGCGDSDQIGLAQGVHEVRKVKANAMTRFAWLEVARRQ